MRRNPNFNYLYNILTSENVVKSVTDNLDNIFRLIPELSYMTNPNKGKDELDNFGYSLIALSKSKNSFEIRLSILLEDIGKTDKNIKKYDHAKQSSKIVKEVLKRLNFDKKEINRICYLVKNHDNEVTRENFKDDYVLACKLVQIQRCNAFAKNYENLNLDEKYFEEIEDIKAIYEYDDYSEDKSKSRLR